MTQILSRYSLPLNPYVFPQWVAPQVTKTHSNSLTHDTVTFGTKTPAKEVPFDLYKVMRERWIRESELSDLKDQHVAIHGHYYGQLPKPFSHAFGSPQKGIQKLDTLANLLSENPPMDTRITKLITPFTVKRLDNGDEGTVYKLANGPDTFALKVYHAGYSGFNHFRFFTFMNAQGAKDALKTFAYRHSGSPEKQARWLLSEFIRSDPPFTKSEWRRRGRSSLAHVAKTHRIYIAGNVIDRVNTVLIDPIVMRHAGDITSLSPDSMQLALSGLRKTLRTALHNAPVT